VKPLFIILGLICALCFLKAGEANTYWNGYSDGWVDGYSDGWVDGRADSYISVEAMKEATAIEFLIHARNSHLSYAERPEWCNKWTGDAEWNLSEVEKYQQIIELVEGIE